MLEVPLVNLQEPLWSSTLSGCLRADTSFNCMVRNAYTGDVYVGSHNIYYYYLLSTRHPQWLPADPLAAPTFVTLLML